MDFDRSGEQRRVSTPVEWQHLYEQDACEVVDN